jgi:hypothetical protein
MIWMKFLMIYLRTVRSVLLSVPSAYKQPDCFFLFVINVILK